ncbi:efflux RND transporter periplasmic adaptor subunit [Sulfurovum sp. NBC37-1]|uniref:efflux RND transporter periplasmic adaptor subunit n=1 Tax=Sulfurovum sp. (strain NBC37-1) TaxID=387093 RepID=UPI00015875A6|nr:efflux RND transporter periplasmic adaptor subunit [Sulfurovum sp. NBC37-1]BAF71513.1 acriflavin resistance protein, AcrA/AcrE family [Sulfurovum sp. NBC37-1]
MRKIVTLIAVFLLSTLNAVEIDLSGSVVSDNQKMMTSRYMGYIKNMAVSEGDIVKKGQLLYEIDSKEIEAAERQVDLAISQARLALQMNKNQYNNVILNLARHKRLYEKKMVSKYELETLELAEKNLKDMVEISQEQVNQALAKKEEVLNQYNYLRITAPNDGVIVAKRINEGEMAIPGMPAVVLTDLSRLKIVAEISETQLPFIHLGKEVEVEVPSLNLKTKGKISSIIPNSNPMTHKFKIKIEFDHKGKSVYPGMYAKIIIR